MTVSIDLADDAAVLATANHWHKMPGTATYLRKTSDRIENDMRWSMFDFIDPAEHAAIKDGTTTFDATAAFHAAQASGERIHIPRGTFLVSGLTGISDVDFEGSGRNSVIKLADGSNTIVWSFHTKSNVKLRNFRIDGNRAGQTTTTLHRGIYVLADSGNCDHFLLEDLEIRDTGGQAVFFSGPGSYSRAGRWSTIRRVRAYDTGHTCFTGGCEIPSARTVWEQCFAYRPANQGFKTAGDHISCWTEGNYEDASGQGEGFENEYDSGSAHAGVNNYFFCGVKGAGGGWRFNGTNQLVNMVGCYAEDIEYSVVTAFGDIRQININGLHGKNFGKAGTRTSSDGLDLVSLLDPNTADPTTVRLSNLTGEDTQGTPTGKHLVYVDDGFKDFMLDGNNEARGLTDSALNMAVVSNANYRIRGYVKGWSCEAQYESAVTVGGTAGTYLMRSHTILRREFRLGAKASMITNFSFSGTTGTKELKILVNSLGSISLATWAAGEAPSSSFAAATVEVEVEAVTSTVVSLLITTSKGAVTTTTRASYSISSGTDIEIKWYALTGATDTMTQTYWKITGRM